MPLKKIPNIAIITATKNAERYLPDLIESLSVQTDNDFEWIICDAKSTDCTLEIINNSKIQRKIIYSRDDFGIYDALNFGIKNTVADYYLVVGSDDLLSPDTIANYKRIASESMPDFIAAAVTINGKLVKPRIGLGWLLGMPGEASSHSVGLMIRTRIHSCMGFYSSKFPIASDQLFVLSCLKKNASIIRAEFNAGTFGTAGTSGSDDFGMITELFRVQIKVGRSPMLQYILLSIRLLKACIIYYFRK